MKTFLSFLCLLLLTSTAQAASASSVTVTTQAVTIPGNEYSLDFGIQWACDDFPRNSAPGRIELVNGSGTVVGRVVASIYRPDNISISVSGGGTVTNTNAWVAVYAPNGTPADGELTGTWNLSGVEPGDYTLRLHHYTTWENTLEATTVWTSTYFYGGSVPTPQNQPPSIAWTTGPGSVAHGQTYAITARGHDPDGNLAQVNIWKNGVPFALTGGGNGTEGDLTGSSTDGGPQIITFTAQAVDAAGETSAVISQTVTVNAPVNTPPTIILLAPTSQTVTAGTTLALSSLATDPDGNLSAHNLDIQRPAGDWNFQGEFATGEPFQGGPVGSPGDSTRTASFTFSDPGTYSIRSGASDGSGWYHSETVAITVVPVAPTQYVLTATAGAGGAVSNGGTFVAGTSATVSATPDAAHDFAGWSGDAGGASNPLTVLMDRDKSVQAMFTLKSFALFTSATAGGAVTQGGTYPPGTTVTISAVADTLHRFVGWAGDAGGTSTTVTVLLDSPKSVQAIFTDKTSQTLTFPAPADQPVSGPPLTLNATASSGLPVSYTVLNGPAVLNGNQLQITGPGAVTVEASQAGDGFYLSAAPVTRTFNTFAAAVLRYRPSGRTLLQSRSANSAAPYVLETP